MLRLSPQSYPLYDSLLLSVKEEPKNIDINAVCGTINSLTKLPKDDMMGHYEIIQSIIMHYTLVNNGSLPNIIPYSGKLMTGGKGPLYMMTNLPPLLQQIIAAYLESIKS